jgi:hypothetical protein
MASVLTSLAVQIRNVSNLYQVYQLSGSSAYSRARWRTPSTGGRCCW